MKKQLKIIAAANAIVLAAVLLISFIGSAGHQGDLTAFIGLGFLFIAAINLIVGAILLFVGLINTQKISIRHYGASMLLVAGIALLCSLTFCSMAFTRV